MQTFAGINETTTMRLHDWKKYLKSLVMPLLVSGTPLLAQTDTPSADGLLWEISGNGLTKPSYIYGTFHLIDAEHFEISPATETAFTACEQMAMEIKMDDPNLITTMLRWTHLPAGKTLADYCTPEEYAQLTAYVKDSLGLDIVQFNLMKPLSLYQLAVASNIEGEAASYERHFLEKSIGQSKDILGLESLEFQLGVFDSIPYEEQIDWIVTATTDSTSMNSSYSWDEMVQTYTSGNIEAIYKLVIEETPELKKYENLLITDRNTKWIPVIEQYVQEKPTFVAVGAAHLGGPNGVIKLLQAEGYTLKPVK